jgi:uncharacterized membrane protein
MPYCTNCGTEAPGNARFCAHCGLAQPGANAYPTPVNVQTPFDTISPRTASILCYIPVFGVIPAIIILASKRFRTNLRVRFDAFQSVYLFVAWLIVSSAIPVILLGIPGWGFEDGIFKLIKLGFLVCWIVLLVKSSNNQQLHLPVVGDLAARSTSEQL